MLAETADVVWVEGLTDLQSVKLVGKFGKIKKRIEALQLLKLPGVYVWESDDSPSANAILQYALKYAEESGGRLLRFDTYDTVQLNRTNFAFQCGAGKFALVCE